MKHVPRVIAAHGMGAALHVNNACGHTFAGAVTGAPPETHSSEGGGVWAEYLPKAALTSNTLFLDDANVLVPVWLGGRGDRPAFPIGRNRIFVYVDSHRDEKQEICRPQNSAALGLKSPWKLQSQIRELISS